MVNHILWLITRFSTSPFSRVVTLISLALPSPPITVAAQQHLTVRLVFKFDLFRQSLSLRAGRAQRDCCVLHIYID
jgi:hypothetical protein